MLSIIKLYRLPVIILFVFAMACIAFSGRVSAEEKMSAKPSPGHMMAKKTTNTPAEVKYADIVGVKRWRPEGVNALVIEAKGGTWYHIGFFSACFPLPDAQKIAFVTNLKGQLDRFDSILVGGQQCYFKEVNEIPDIDKYTTENPLNIPPWRGDWQ